jgi:hypothetical protein
MNSVRTARRSQSDLLRAKIAAGAVAKAAADADLLELVRATNAVIGDFFLVPGADCRLVRRAANRDSLGLVTGEARSFWRFGHRDRPVLVGFNDRLIIAAADIAIARSISAAEGASPTAIDRAVSVALARRLAFTIDPQATVDQIKPVECGLIDELLDRDAPLTWRLLTIAIEIRAVQGSMTAFVAIPEACGASAAASARSDTLLGRFHSLNATAHCIGGSFQAPLKEVLKLAPGDTVVIDWRGVGTATLMLARSEFARGSLGEHNGRRAIKISDN